MYSVFVLQEMRVEYSIRHVINRREYPSYDIRRVLDTLIIARVKEQESEVEGERKLYLLTLYRDGKETKVLAAQSSCVVKVA